MNLSKNVLPIFVAAVAVFCFLSITTAANAATVSGQVSSQVDGTGLGRATVTALAVEGAAEAISTRADDNGNYSISGLPAGDYLLTVTYVGFSSQTFTVTVGDSELTHNFVLTPSLINLQNISVTASRAEEKLVDAPAAVHVVSEEYIASHTALSPADHVRGLPSVDVVSTGLNQSNVVVRGFNNIFSGALMVMVDNRIARVPSLRFNAYQFIPTTDEDIQSIEVVSGPGSALYGPNAAAGVLHMITKSPFSHQGTTVSVGGGERELFIGTFRHASSLSEKVAFKISGQYYQGLDWKLHFDEKDEFEPDSIQLFRPGPSGPQFVGSTFANERDYDIKRFSGEGRIDFLLGDNTSLIFNSGINRSSNIELTGLGAGQAIDWTYWYGQARLRYKDLFVQTFVNASDAGDTYLLRTGQLIVDRSKLLAGQIQHRYKPSDRMSLTYGLDLLFTRPETDSTINGRHEDDDNTDEIGAYLQTDYKLSDMFKFVGALRVDDHSRLEDKLWSPRAGLVYQPDANNSFRGTYNRAFSTPDNNTLFLDILQAQDPFGAGIDIRVQGVPSSGFNWRFDTNGNPRFRSQFAPIAGMSTSDFIDFNDPIFTGVVMWGVGRSATISGFAAALAADSVPGPIIQSFSIALDSVSQFPISGVNNTLMTFNPDIANFEPSTIADIVNIEPLRPTITETFEFGYKGIINDRIQFSADFYRTKKFDFIGPLIVETPNVFLDPATLAAALTGDFATAYAGASPSVQATLDSLDLFQFGGNGDGSPIDELITMFTTGAASIPFGTVTPEEALNPDALLVTYRNFGDINFYGADFALDFQLNRSWAVR
ncbi:MAG: TonB-dependent receptor, partial [candidate division Zixibacteria bacterium]|nr:TonB-dependent receptor [candidate division Zixibacteria bacterium]